MISRAAGSTASAAISPCATPMTIFSAAMYGVGIGARSRSSISLVQPKSCTMGSVTDCTAANVRLSARIPGTSVVVYPPRDEPHLRAAGSRKQ